MPGFVCRDRHGCHADAVVIRLREPQDVLRWIEMVGQAALDPFDPDIGNALHLQDGRGRLRPGDLEGIRHLAPFGIGALKPLLHQP